MRAFIVSSIGKQLPSFEEENNLVGYRNMEKIKRFLKDEEGVTAIEYGLIAALIALVIIGAVTLVGKNLSKTFTSIANTVTGT
jgi:pilus assembly protein Flp/PilA